uniref:Uncharacterized protein n=1 Tax=Ditylenchus dipsaci TaxID=166011 RepID=A0A915E8Z9_9BILA
MQTSKILSAITFHNQQRYNKRIFAQSRHTLTESYQLSENVRTGKQLAPTFLFHFINTITVALLCITLIYFVETELSKSFTLVVFFQTVAIANLGIITTIIRNHPILNRKAVNVCKNFKTKMCRMFFSETHPENSVGANIQIPTTINGKSLINTIGIEDHFSNLQASWN